MTTIEAIETSYAGYRFRSRQEARWAVFFDDLGLPWKYEPQGYVLDGMPYLPDFLLEPETERQTWFEVKGKFPTAAEIDKARKLALGTGIRTYLYFGPIEPPGRGLSSAITTWNEYFDPATSQPQWSDEHGWMYRASDALRWEAPLYPTAFRFEPGEQERPRGSRSGFWWWTDCPICGHFVLKLHGLVGWCPNIPHPEGSSWPEGVSDQPQFAHETGRLLAAYQAARSARFEHGETPGRPRKGTAA